MFDIVLIAYLSYRNGLRAKLKGQNPWIWGIATLVAYIFTMMIGVMFVIVNFCKDTITLSRLSSMDSKAQEAARQQLIAVFDAHWLHMVTIEMFGIGGFLIVRYMLDRKPDKKTPEVSWMDKVGNGE